ncbi:MAG TPA: hypothetical protein VM511_06095 [Luteolibacter sp.]|nr:hypothetical protein [Luteolibacter sp.]
MTTPTNPTASVDEGIHAVLSSAKEKAIDRLEEWEDCVRRHPSKAILAAVAAGVLLHRLPVRSILVANVRLVSALAPPALLAYGAAKLCEILQKKGRGHRESASLNRPIDPGI